MILSNLDKFEFFIDRFGCFYKQLGIMGYTPQPHYYWNVGLDAGNRFFLKPRDPNGHNNTNPLALFLIGQPINTNIYGVRNNYRTYLADNSNYLLLQIEDLLQLPAETLREHFRYGFDVRGSYNDYSGSNQLRTLAFNTGRYLLKKYWGFDHPYKKFKIFDD